MFWTLLEAATPEPAQLGAERSLVQVVQIQSPRLKPIAGGFPGYRDFPRPPGSQWVTLVFTILRSDSLTGPFTSSVFSASARSSPSVSTSDRLRLSFTSARIIFTS
jgi:hypothetical protein